MLLEDMASQLQTLTLGPNIPQLERSHDGSDNMEDFFPLRGMPALKELVIWYEMFPWEFIWPDPKTDNSSSLHQGLDILCSPIDTFPSLHTLRINAEGDIHQSELGPLHIWAAIDSGLLPNLRIVKAHRRLRWEEGGAYGSDEPLSDLRDLDDLLKALAEEDWERGEAGGYPAEDAGVSLLGRK